MALCGEVSLFSFPFPIKSKSPLKSSLLLICGGEGPQPGWPRSALPTRSLAAVPCHPGCRSQEMLQQGRGYHSWSRAAQEALADPTSSQPSAPRPAGSSLGSPLTLWFPQVLWTLLCSPRMLAQRGLPSRRHPALCTPL